MTSVLLSSVSKFSVAAPTGVSHLLQVLLQNDRLASEQNKSYSWQMQSEMVEGC